MKDEVNTDSNVTREQSEAAKRMDLPTYLQIYDPNELKHIIENHPPYMERLQ